jgi:hypothetical protein
VKKPCNGLPVFVVDWSILDEYVSTFYDDAEDKPVATFYVEAVKLLVRNYTYVLYTPDIIANLLKKTYAERDLVIGSLLEAVKIETMLDHMKQSDAVLRLASLKLLDSSTVYIVSHDRLIQEKAKELKIPILTCKEAIEILKPFNGDNQ